MGVTPSKSPLASTPVDELDEKRLSSRLSNVHLSAQSPVSNDGSLVPDQFSSWEHDIVSKPNLELARTILNHNDVRTLQSRKAVITDSHVFNHEVKFKTNPITNQKSSGRCWLFATTNVLRYNVMKKFNLEDFQLSQVCSSAFRQAKASTESFTFHH